MSSRFLSGVFLAVFGLSSTASAMSNKNWETVSDVGVYSTLAMALGLPAYRGDWEGFKQAAYSAGAAEGVAQVGKAIVHEERPDKSDSNSFPSGHTSVAFASATTIYRRYGWDTALPAYALAALTAVGRVEAKKHYWHDVAAGAVIGTTSGWLLTDAFNKTVQLMPWVEGGGGGLVAVVKW
ncbi:MAG: phosphatase PAP2 family protein [Rhodocyclaceae bacterium]|nr:phosphatase PAP2 family protein [Rhodocyclaceae bacterium]